MAPLANPTKSQESASGLGSSASASPNPAGTGQVISFSAATSDPQGDVVSISWNFGDGASSSGDAVQHVYATPGSYTVTATASDTQGHRTSSSLTVSVGAPIVGVGGLDSDHDGFSDTFETAVGTSPLDAGSSPTGSVAPRPEDGSFSALKIVLNFAKAGSDSIGLQGSLPLPDGNFSFAGQKVIVDVGGALSIFTLDAKAKALPKGLTMKLDLKSRLFHFALKNKGDFAAALAADGLVNGSGAQAVNVPVTVIFAGHIFTKTFTLAYTAREGKTGKTGK